MRAQNSRPGPHSCRFTRGLSSAARGSSQNACRRMKRDAAALIDEANCIGCTRCIDACPVDAIVGAQGLMHTVVESWCIGCALCLPPCPVDCIEMAAPRGE